MTRKDYELIASVLLGHITGAMEVGDNHSVKTLELFVNELGEQLEMDNPRFNGARFIQACGLKG